MKNQDITKVISKKRAYKTSSFLVFVDDNNSSGGVEVSNAEKKGIEKIKIKRNVSYLAPKKIFKTAVLRNKVKRLIRESFNEVVKTNGFSDLVKDKLFVFSPNSNTLKTGRDCLIKDISFFFKKLGF
jgi:ribonuclease P protein component